MGTRRPNGESSVYQGIDGKWHGRVTVGIRDDGRPDRRHIERKTEREVRAAVKELASQRDACKVRRASRDVWTVEKWLTHWIETIAVPPAIKASTHAGYEVDVRVHLIPGVGGHRIERLTPEQLERFYLKLLKAGKAPGTVNHVHRTIRTALNVAVRRGHITANPAMSAKAPASEPAEVEPYLLEEVRRILDAASQLPRNGARWALALSLGLRQSEVLGLQWSDADLERGMLSVRRGRPRPRYAHGCAKPCGKKAGYCPERRQTNEDATTTKSRAGRRKIGLPTPLVELLVTQKKAQDQDRVRARQLWAGENWIFATETGRALNPNTDYHNWKSLLQVAGVRDGRLHDARHTAATVLLILGVPERTVTSLMGWSSSAMAARYQHVIDPLRDAVAAQVGGLLWAAGSGDAGGAESQSETETETDLPQA